jgi:SAM-dependent methyltransferase
MDQELNYIDINRALWDEKTKYHTSSPFYNMDDGSFLGGRSSLNEIELQLLGDVSGKSVLHLQCHFGQDSLSLARLGAAVTGIDFSGEAINKAKELNEQLGLNASFICTDIYELPEKLDQRFDIVFTSYGVLGWLPDMQKWAQMVAQFLKPEGKFVMVEFHPVIWMFNYDFTGVEYSYFNRGPIIEMAATTYADRDAVINKQEIGWNHDLSEVVQNVLSAGLRIVSFNEFDSSPYSCFKNMIEIAPGKFQVKGLEGKIPMLYSIMAIK